jgi:hypothetical protein
VSEGVERQNLLTVNGISEMGWGVFNDLEASAIDIV